MTYQLHPCSIPNDVAAELAAAEEAARREARERIVAAVRERAAEEARVAEALAAELALAAEAAAAAGPGAALLDGAPRDEARGGFGRGWIPVERDIGLPIDEFGEGGDAPGQILPVFPVGTNGEVAGPQGLTEGACAAYPSTTTASPPRSPSPFALRENGEDQGRIWRSIDFTPPRRAMFLHHLAEQGNVRVACSLVRISPQAAYLARRRDAIFRAGWDAALVHSREHALQVLANRALDGIREEVWHRGEKVGEKVRHDARLLLAHLGRLDARCKDTRAMAHAERFDELLALVAGEDYSCNLRDGGDGAAGGAGPADGDEILPITREHHSNRAASRADTGFGPHEEAFETIDQDEIAAREVAEAEWDEWEDRVDAVNDALEAGEEPVVAEPPYEVKSLGGMAPRSPGRAEAARRAGRRGPEFSLRTLFGSSTWSAAGREIGARVASFAPPLQGEVSRRRRDGGV